MVHLTGKAGEHVVTGQLMLRGVNVYWPSVDRGCDLLTESGCRIQVKTSHMCSTPKALAIHGEGSYFFPLPRTRRIAVSDNKARTIAKPLFVENCDVVVFWGVETNRFWVVPAELCDRVQAFVLGPSNERRFSGSIEDLREMSRLGYSHQKIADHYNMDRAQVTTYINDTDRMEVKASTVSLARACENAWQNITDFERTTVALPGPRILTVEEK